MKSILFNSCVLLLVLWTLQSEASAQPRFVLHFDSNSAVPLESDLMEFNAWLELQDDNGKHAAFIAGHTDSRSSEIYNEDLAENRTEAVANLLREKGFSDIAARSFGESQPTCREQSEACDQRNRRVEIVLMSAQELTRYLLDSTEEQVFFIHPSRSNTIQGNQGTVLEFPAECFANASRQQVKDSVRIVLKEYYNASDFLAGGLTTTSQGRLLQTGGTIYVAATSRDEPVEMAAGMGFNAFFTGRKQDDLMQAFMGKMVNGIIDWTVVAGERLDYMLPDLAQSLDRSLREQAELVAEDFIRSKGERSGRKDYVDTEIMVNGRPTRLLYRPFVPSKVEARGGLVIPRLGWINCDRFLRSQEQLVDVRMDTGLPEASYYLILPEARAVMPAYSCGFNQEVCFPNIPLGEPCTLLIMKRNGATMEWTLCDFRAGETVPDGIPHTGNELAMKDALKSVLWTNS